MEGNHYISDNLILVDFNLILASCENAQGFEMLHKILSTRPGYWHNYICIVCHHKVTSITLDVLIYMINIYNVLVMNPVKKTFW